ncbi:MAG: hypothetical protein WAV73_06295 [Candidatus Moraniibacteriota bacterium]
MRIIKLLVVILLVFVIIVSFGFAYLKASAQNTGSNYFNNNLRYKFARYPVARKILGLHFDGDAKADYLGNRYQNITIKIISMNGLGISDETAKVFSKRVENITGKKTKYLFYPSIPYKSLMGAEELRKSLGAMGSSRDAAIYVFVVSQDADSGILGSTVLENGIGLFKNSLANDMRMDSEENVDSYVASLLLHEFGHQIGLGHNSVSGCLMNERTEFSDGGRLLEKIGDFCEFEKKQIKNSIL